MPVQVVPPMYNMLADEIKWALADVCHYFYRVVHFIFLKDWQTGRAIPIYASYHPFSGVPPFGRRRVGTSEIGPSSSFATSRGFQTK